MSIVFCTNKPVNIFVLLPLDAEPAGSARPATAEVATAPSPDDEAARSQEPAEPQSMPLAMRLHGPTTTC